MCAHYADSLMNIRRAGTKINAELQKRKETVLISSRIGNLPHSRKRGAKTLKHLRDGPGDTHIFMID